MSSLDKALETQLANIQKKTGKTLGELAQVIEKSGLTAHGETRDMLKATLGLGHGDANALVHALKNSDGTRAAADMSPESILSEIYKGPREAMRPIHDALMERIEKLGPFDTIPKKGYLSLRRKKQFVMLGPKTNTRFELGINAKALKGAARLVEQPAGGMCNYVVVVAGVSEVDAALMSWVKAAYDAAG